jgi:hypothetical protein
MPDQPAPLDANAGCFLQVVDARKAELFPSAERYDRVTNVYEQCAFRAARGRYRESGFYAKTSLTWTIFPPGDGTSLTQWQGRCLREDSQ